MKIVIAFDSFKDSISSTEACTITRDILLSRGIDAIIKPMADGGEGTAAAILAASDGQWIPVRVMGPLPHMRIDSGFAWFPSTQRALVEMASASGITLLNRIDRNPMLTTTFGTGELIAAAIQHGARHIWLAVGGSATIDGGIGAAQALGWHICDTTGAPVVYGGQALAHIVSIRQPDGWDMPPVEVLCDVDNPLCGKCGAATIYGPQKGATPAMVTVLDDGLRNLSKIVTRDMKVDIVEMPGSGAAGGLGGGAAAFFNATLVSGIETVMQVSGLPAAMDGADWIITGEGAFDRQSLMGKVVSGIIRVAKSTHTKVAIIAGTVKLKPDEYRHAGVMWAAALKKPRMCLDESIDRCRELLAVRVEEFILSLEKNQ